MNGAQHLSCPRCEYDLRGLPTPRCPECGLAFRWEDVRSTPAPKESYFFEYCIGEAPIASAWNTWRRALRPIRFWDWLQPGWYVRGAPLVTYGVALLLLAGALQIFVSSALHFASIHWYHGGQYSVSVYAPVLIPIYAHRTIPGLVPPLIAGAILCMFHGLSGASKAETAHALRVGIYSASVLLLVPLTTLCRIIAPLLLYPFDPQRNWALAFWWLLPGGSWSPRVRTQGLDIDWYTSHVDWTNLLRILSLSLVMIMINSAIVRQLVRRNPWRRVGTFGACIGTVALAMLWPVIAVYAVWWFSLITATQRYLCTRRGWLLGAGSGAIGLFAGAIADYCMGNRGIFLGIVRAWPL